MRLINISADIALSSVEAAVFPIGCDCRHLLHRTSALLSSQRSHFMARANNHGQRNRIEIGVNPYR